MTGQTPAGKAANVRRESPSLISVVAPAFNEEENLRALFESVRNVLKEIDVPFELLIVENGSCDGSHALLEKMHEEDARVQYIRLSRNFGHQGALTAGLVYARGDAVVTMDADLQHPPEVLPEMIEQWRAGFDVVVAAAYENRTQSLVRQGLNRLYYSIIAGMSGLNLKGGVSDFRLMDRAAVDIINSLPERARYLRGLARWIGFEQTAIDYEISERHKGHSKFNRTQLVRFGIDGVLAFSILPLRLFLLAGFLVSGSAVLYAVFLVVSKIISRYFSIETDPVDGFTTIAAGIFFLGGVILMGIGILGEYIGRIYDETKARPTFIVRDSSMQNDQSLGSDPNGNRPA
jgi:glycosyltransferase involved in cell wall biosynthesis